jgi:hypothetical protein
MWGCGGVGWVRSAEATKTNKVSSYRGFFSCNKPSENKQKMKNKKQSITASILEKNRGHRGCIILLARQKVDHFLSGFRCPLSPVSVVGPLCQPCQPRQPVCHRHTRHLCYPSRKPTVRPSSPSRIKSCSHCSTKPPPLRRPRRPL